MDKTKKPQILIWSQLTKNFHPICFMRRTGEYLLGETVEMEPCPCVPNCQCQFEEDFVAGLIQGLPNQTVN